MKVDIEINKKDRTGIIKPASLNDATDLFGLNELELQYAKELSPVFLRREDEIREPAKAPSSYSAEGITKFALSVLDSENLDNWSVEWTRSSSGFFMRKSRRVAIPERIIRMYIWEAKEYVLHEVAHIQTEEDRKHGPVFYKEFARLVTKYMTGEE